MTRGTPIIHNVSDTRVRFRLNFTQEPASPGVRRRPVTPEVGLDPHKQLDLCEVHKITVEDAWRIIETSPDIARFKNTAPPKLRVFDRDAHAAATAAVAPAAAPPPAPEPAPVVLGVPAERTVAESIALDVRVEGILQDTLADVAEAAPDAPPDAPPEASTGEVLTPPPAPPAAPAPPLSPGRAIIPTLDVGPIDITKAVFGQDAAPTAGAAGAISPEVAAAQRNARSVLEAEVWQRMGADPDNPTDDDVAVVTGAPRGALPEGVIDTDAVEAAALVAKLGGAGASPNAPGVLGPEDAPAADDAPATSIAEGGEGEEEADAGSSLGVVPDASWKVDRLIAFAEEHDIPLHGVKQKPKVLRKIAEWREKGGAA